LHFFPLCGKLQHLKSRVNPEQIGGFAPGFTKGIFMWRKGWERWHRAVTAVRLACVLGSVGVFGFASICPSLVQARSLAFSNPIETVSIAQLPPQGRDMMTLIYQGGPFRHDKDGVVFGNRERILPAKNRPYYLEYTVRTPGERSRGARRIVCGGLKPAAPDVCYYTDDHYASFRTIVH
jgi:ribonuclease T1